MNIRFVERKDVRPIMEIYRYYIDNTDITFEYTLPTEEEFTQRILGVIEKYPYLVAEEDGVVLGYAYASDFKSRRAYDWSVETSIYVNKDGKRGGIGKALYEELEKRLKAQNIVNLYACITYPNETSEAFHRKFGYRTVARFEKCGFKFDRWLDMIWMEKHLSSHEENPKPVKWVKHTLDV